MPNYKKLYFQMFNDVTDVIEKLKQIQQKAEEEYIKEKTDFELIQIEHKE